MAKVYDLGILGGGQLARMTALSARAAGLSTVVLDPATDCPAAFIADVIPGTLNDPEAIRKIADLAGALTLENEFVPADAVRAAGATIMPGVETLAVVQDKLFQRQAYAAAGVRSPRAVDAKDAPSIGFPCVLKARFGGYDGKGTRYARSEAEWDALRPEWESGGWLAEEWVQFKCELSVMAYVDANGRAGAFPAMITEQKNSVCDLVYPFPEYEEVPEAALKLAIEAVHAIGGVGLFGVEMFATEDGIVSINEIAPRPHNSGHYTQDWGAISQFEAHWRLALGATMPEWPQGRPTAMANLLGIEGAGNMADAALALLRDPRFGEAHVHVYNKMESRPGRKMGHINFVAQSAEDAWFGAKLAQEAFVNAWSQ